MDGYIGQIALVPYDFVPWNWHLCDGTLLDRDKHGALYSLLGERFGNGFVTSDRGNKNFAFALPTLESPDPELQYCICINGTYPSKS